MYRGAVLITVKAKGAPREHSESTDIPGGRHGRAIATPTMIADYMGSSTNLIWDER